MRLIWKNNDITGYTTSCAWSGSAKQAARTVTFNVAYSPNDKNAEVLNIQNGDKITFYPGYPEDKKTKFVGIVTTRERKSEAGELSYTAMDKMIHLLRSSGTYKFENKTPEKITKMVCNDLKIQTGNIAKTKLNIAKIFFQERPYYEIIMAAYTKVHRKNKKVYIAQMKADRLEVIEKGKIIPDFRIAQGESITDSSYSETIDNMVNRVYIYNSDNKKIGSISNADWVKKYGVFQNAISVESGTGKTEAKAELQGIDKSASLTAIGDIRCVAGMGIIIQDSRTGLNGKFWIENDSHEFSNGMHMMTLQLAFKNIMDEQEEDEEQTKQSTQTGGVTISGVSGSSDALNAVLNQARALLGLGESPPGSNHNIVTQTYGSDDMWCCMFIWYIFMKAGQSALFMGGAKEAYCFNVMDWYKDRGKWGGTPKVGALVIFGGTGHIGIVESVSASGYVTIEGNTSGGSPGGSVQRKTFHSNVLGFCYPDYPVTTTTTSSGTETLQGTKVRAKFTAYYPHNDPMEGGYLDAYDTELSYWTNQGIKVIAAPPSVPKDAQVQVIGTGTNRDGGIYRVRDRGGAIQIESGNVYHFDLLMGSAAECNAWGVRYGYAIIKT